MLTLVVLNFLVIVLLRYCNAFLAITPDFWGPWGSYGSCSLTCGGGSQTRTRQCIFSIVVCSGSQIKTRDCNMNPCPYWGQWQSWRACSQTCGWGSQTRTRQCVNSNTGACTGLNMETQTCNAFYCPQWGQWVQWRACSQTCGWGTQSRTRQCVNSNNGACSGSNLETQTCNARSCPPVNGQWGSWQSWGTCSKTCGGGSQSRSRQCDNPPPAHGVADCSGSSTETQDCNALPCQVEGPETQSAAHVAAIASGAAVGGVGLSAAIAAVIFFVFVRRRGRNTHDASGTDVDRHAHGKTSSATSPEGGTTTDDNYEDVSGLVPARESQRRTNPDSAATDTSSATATTTGATVYQNVGEDAAANYERLDSGPKERVRNTEETQEITVEPQEMML